MARGSGSHARREMCSQEGGRPWRNPGITPGSAIDPPELAQAKYSAFFGGRLVSAFLSDSGWHGIIQEDLGLLLHHAFGPSGHAYKWANLYTDSTWIMHKKGSQTAPRKKCPGYGVDGLSSPQQRDALARASNIGLVPLFVPRLNRAEYMGGATLEHLSIFISDDIMARAFSHGNVKEWFKQNDTPIGQ
eukprot:2251779-Pyramimonas_sp.AAC.1